MEHLSGTLLDTENMKQKEKKTQYKSKQYQ